MFDVQASAPGPPPKLNFLAWMSGMLLNKPVSLVNAFFGDDSPGMSAKVTAHLLLP